MTGIFDWITGQNSTGQADADAQTATAELNDLTDDSDSQATPPDTEPENRTEKRLRDAAQELLRYGLLEESQKPNLYRATIVNIAGLNGILEPLDLSAHADEIRGLVYLKVRKNDNADEPDEWEHPLVRRQRLTLEQSLLVAILRQYFIAYEQEAGAGASQAIVAVDELIPQLQVYLGDTGSEAKERNRILQLLDQLKGHGLVSAPDSHERVVIRPMIAHLANPENLQALLNGIKAEIALGTRPGPDEGGE